MQINKKIQERIALNSTIPLEDFRSLTQIAQKYKPNKAGKLIQSWLRNLQTIRFLALWEKANNQKFNQEKYIEFKTQKENVINFSFNLNKWTDELNGIGLISQRGRYGKICSHKDIALEFEKWLQKSPTQQPNGLYIIRINEFYKIGITQNIESRLKTIETNNPYKPELIFYEKVSESFEIEQFLHRKLKRKNIKNEWFKLSKKDVKSTIKEIVKLTNIEYLTNRQNKILEIVKNETSTINLSKEIGFSKTTILKELKYLIKIGKVNKIRNGRKISYKLN